MGQTFPPVNRLLSAVIRGIATSFSNGGFVMRLPA
jgi:hypothetical protein